VACVALASFACTTLHHDSTLHHIGDHHLQLHDGLQVTIDGATSSDDPTAVFKTSAEWALYEGKWVKPPLGYAKAAEDTAVSPVKPLGPTRAEVC